MVAALPFSADRLMAVQWGEEALGGQSLEPLSESTLPQERVGHRFAAT
jgi:hypothetical protein